MSDEKLWKELEKIIAASDDKHLSDTLTLYEDAVSKGDMRQAHDLLREMTFMRLDRVSNLAKDSIGLTDRAIANTDRAIARANEVATISMALIKFIKDKGLTEEFTQWATQYEELKDILQSIKERKGGDSL